MIIKLYNTLDNVILIKSNYDIQKLKKECHNIINSNLNKSHISVYNNFGWNKYPLYLPISHDRTFSESTLITKNNFTDYIFAPTHYLDNCPYIKEIINSFNAKIYYCNLSKLLSNSKIKIHKDIDAGPLDWLNMDKIMRLHIPIITNHNVKFFIGEPIIKEYYLQEGNLYYIRSGDKPHYVENNSNQDRYHLIIDLQPTPDLLNKIIV